MYQNPRPLAKSWRNDQPIAEPMIGGMIRSADAKILLYFGREERADADKAARKQRAAAGVRCYRRRPA